MVRKVFSSSKAWILLVIAIVVIIALYFFFANHITPSTNDAHVHAYTVPVASQVSGRVTQVYVENNAIVKKGQPLFQIDKRDYTHQVELQQANVAETQDQVKQYQEQILQAKLTIKERESDLATAQQHYNENIALTKKGYVSKSKMLDFDNNLINAKEKLLNSQQALAKARQLLGNNINGENVHLKKAKAALALAQLHLSETTVYAPDEGQITNLHMNVGSYARVGEAQMALSVSHDWWVLANIKENNLRYIKPGNEVLVSLNMYPGRIFKGTVMAVGGGISKTDGMPKNYLPFIKKTHDWVRLAQRFPVQIQIDESTLHGKKLRAGASATITIYTGDNGFWNGLGYFYQWLGSYFEYLS